MRWQNLTLAALFSAGLLGMSALPAAGADDGILFRVRAGDSNYCHLKFPAIQEGTLSWNRPVLKTASSGDIIDFYGPCNFDPTGKEAAQAQQRDHYDTVTNNE